MKRAIAVFDVDGTLLPGHFAERIFVRYLWARRQLHHGHLFRFASHFVATVPRSWDLATRGNKFYLEGEDPAEIRRLAADCFREEIVPRISAAGLAVLDQHRERGLLIVLLSGTLDVLLTCFQEHLGAEHAHGSTLRVVGGRYTGELDGLYPYGRTKRDIAERNYGGDAYDLSQSYAYADRPSDLSLLQLFGHPVVVNPHPRWAARALRLGLTCTRF